MVHMSLVEMVWLADSRITITIFVLRTHVGVVSHLSALVTLNLAKVLRCRYNLTVLVMISSIAISFPIAITILVPIVMIVAIMVVVISSMLIVSIAIIVIMSMVMSFIPIV